MAGLIISSVLRIIVCIAPFVSHRVNVGENIQEGTEGVGMKGNVRNISGKERRRDREKKYNLCIRSEFDRQMSVLVPLVCLSSGFE